MGQRAPFAPAWGWVSLTLWTVGSLVRWASIISAWRWQVLVPFASVLELTAFLIVFRMVSRHRPARNPGALKQKPEARMGPVGLRIYVGHVGPAWRIWGASRHALTVSFFSHCL